MEFRQLLPQPASVALDELLASVKPRAGAPTGRPHVIVNFVSSVDGRAAFRGRSGALGDDGDHALFHGLRERVDAVLVGTSTLRAERYGRILSRPERRERRAAAGRSPEPLTCLVTESGELPLAIPLFAETEARIVVFSSMPLHLSSVQAAVDNVVLEPGQLTLTTALGRLRSDYDIDLLLCEGGPSLFGSLLREGLVDELFLTLAPKLTGGGEEPTITLGPELPELAQLITISLLERAGSLYLRYGLQQSSG